jgi:lysophospholipase L1-like esterase
MIPPQLAFALGLLVFPLAQATAETAPKGDDLRYNFAQTSHAYADAPLITRDTLYTAERGYGFLPAASAGTAFHFVVDLPEGNYDVTVQLGDAAEAGDTTVKAETRRLMLESVRTAPGEFVSRTFTVNVRTPAIAGTDRRVALKDRERDALHWDDKLILEFNGPRPAVTGLSIRRNDSALTVYLAGDSTVTDQPGEPWAAWGQMLPRFFPAGVAIANHAESGLSLASFRASARLDKILSTLRPGDYVLIQFGHNDQKETGEGVGAFTTYADSLRAYVDAIRAKGGEPVLITSMYRRRFPNGVLQDTLGDFPEAVRRVSQERKVPLIDLHAMSARLFTALGPDRSKEAFVHFPAGAYGSDKAVRDDTHFSPYGAYELARCIVEGIRQNVPALAVRLAPDVTAYDPASPADTSAFPIPPSPPRGNVRIPDGDGR